MREATAQPRTRLLLLIALAILLPALLAVHALREERRIAGVQRELESAYLRDPDFLPRIGNGETLRTAPPRLNLALALLYAQQASRQPRGPMRTATLARARERADRAGEARPVWGEALLVQAYIASLDPRRSAEAIDLLGRSYQAAGFLSGSEAWRVGYGIAHWHALQPATRDHVIEEAVWLARHKVELRRDVFARARGTDAYWPLLRRWRDLRIEDGNYYAGGS